MVKILLVEDDPRVSAFIQKGLRESGYTLDAVDNAIDAIELFDLSQHQLLILDIMLPGITGLELCRSIRSKNKSVPILFLTALGTAENVVLGLSSGADDYLVKPFKFIELEARIKTLLRRSQHQETKGEVVLWFDGIEMNNDQKKVQLNEQVISLTSTEYRLLEFFLRHPFKVLSRQQIIENVWGENYRMGTNVVDVYVNYLRKKIEPIKGYRQIHTVIGMGYVLKENE